MLRTKKEVDRHVRELLNKTKCENDRRAKGYNIARLYFNVGEYECSRRYLAEFLSFRPKSPEAHKLTGQIFEKLGQKEKAVDSYKTSYSISDTQKDLVPKICELYAELDVDPGISSHWADEGDRLYPHHNSIVKLRQSLALANPSKSKDEMEKSFLGALNKSPLSLDLHVKLAKHYLEWGKEQEEKFDTAFDYVWRVEVRRPFPHSLEWYQTMVEVFKAYENWKKPKDDKVFEELYLTILDRFVFESIASSCGPALSAVCSPREAALRLQEFDERLVRALKILDKNSDCAKYMIAQYYFHFALLLAIFGRTESILHKDIYIGCLLLHACFLPSKLSKPSFNKEDREEILKAHLFIQGHYRVSQTGHILNKLAYAYRGKKYLLNKIQEMCNNDETKKHIHKLVFDSPSEVAAKSYLLLDSVFLKTELRFVDEKVQYLCDQELSLTRNQDLREIVWLFIQYSPNSSRASTKFLNFTFFRRIPFSSSLSTFAPETLCHLDLIAFIVAAAYCHQTNTDSYVEVGTSCPSILAAHLYTPEQGEWWNAVSVLCLNERSKHLNRLRSVLQNGLESIRHLGHHILPLQVTVHLARYFTSCIQEARDEGNSASEIESLEERAEHYWSKAVAQIFKASRGTLGPIMKSRLFEIRRCEYNESELNDIGEEGELFIADRMIHKGKREEAIQILSRLKSPKAAFNRAMLYKKEAQSLLGNRTWYSLNTSARNEYTSLLTQTRDALYLTLDRLKMPGVDPSDPLNLVLSDELTSIEHSLATVTLDDCSDNEPMDTLAVNPNLPLILTNGNASTPDAWGGQPFGLTSTMFSTPISTSRIQRQEARPSPERLDAQVRHLTEIQQNTIKNIEEHNAALRVQNEALLQTCQTMASEFKENVAFYKSYIEQRNTSTDLMNPVLDQMKQLQNALKNLQLDVRNIASELSELKNVRIPQNKAEPLHLVTAGTSAAEAQVPLDMASPAIQGVYSNYMGFYGQQPVGSPLVAPAAIFNPCQPPFMPPSTLQDQPYLPPASITMKSDHASILSATTLYQHGLKVAQNKMDKDMSTTQVPPHSYQISLPSSSVMSFPSMSQSFPLTASSEHTFNTEGLLSNVPAPLYSAITTYQSPEKGNRNLLVSSLTSTPVTNKINLKGDSNFSPIFGQWPNSGADFPGSSPKPVRTPSGDAKITPNRSANESDRYIEDEHDPCPDFKPIIPLPEQVEVNTGEENEKVLFEGRAKLYRFVDKEWKERGLGPLKVLHNEVQNTVRVLMRRDQTHKICCNHLISSTMDLSPMKENDKSWLWAAQDFADEKLTSEKFCCKFKTSELAQDFQKAFYKGKMIAEEFEKTKNDSRVKDEYSFESDTLPDTSTTPVAKPSEMKSLQEMFKPEEGSWSCPTCLVKNKKEVTDCLACQTHKPGDTSAKISSDTSSINQETPKVKFRFGISSTSSPSTSPSTTLTFLGDKSGAKTVLSFGTPVSKQGIVFGTPLSTSTVSSGTTSIFNTSTGSLTFGPSSSVTINAIKQGSTPISLFKTSAPDAPTAIVISADALKENISSKNEGGKFSMEGFTFSAQPTLTPPKPLISAETKLPEKPESKKESIFSNFTFTSSKPSTDSGKQGSFLFNLPVSTVASASTTQESTTSIAATQPSDKGLLWSKINTDSVFSFSSLAASETAGDSKKLFSTKDSKAFEPKPLFGKTVSAETKKSDSVASADASKDDIEEYEPQVDFKPVVPMPDLVEVKTGEEEEQQLFCERAKLFRYDPDNKEWKERGIGDAKLLKNISSSKIRFLMRRDQTHKVCANHFLTKDMIIAPMANSDKAWVWGAHDFADEEMKMEKFAIRFKTVELTQSFKTVFEEAQMALPTAGQIDDEEISTAASEKVSDVPKPLSEIFKPSVGSWECSVCLVRNPCDSAACLACSTPKDGETTVSSSTGSSVFGSSAFPFKSNSSGGAFLFGVPSTTEPSSTSGSSGFMFGIPSSTTSSDSNKTSDTTTTSTPLTFTWKPPVGTQTTSITTPTTSTTTTVTTTPIKSGSSAASGFTFGSPGKYKFEFSGVKSPRSRETSTCESEGVEEEEEEDNLYFEPVIPLPDKVEVVTGEEDENALFSHRAKLFRIKDGEFKERGLGDIKLLEHKVNGKIRLLMRREQVHKICLNHYLAKDLQFVHKDEKSVCWIATDFSEQEPVKETFAIRFKTSEIKNSFLAAIQEAQVKLGGDSSLQSDVTPKVTSTTTATATTTVTESKTVTSVEKVSPFGVFGKASITTTPKTMYSFGDKSSPNAKGEDFEVLYEKKATPKQIEAAKKLFLPDNFYLYEDNPPCPGCIGCSPDEFVFKKVEKRSQSSAKETPSFLKTNIFGLSTTTTSSPSTLFTPKVSASQTSSTPTNIFGSASSFVSDGTAPTSLFGSDVPATKSIFGGTPTGSIFGSSPSTGFESSVPVTKSIFGGTPTGSIFGGAAPAKGSIFGGTPTSGSIFGGAPSSTSIFGGGKPSGTNSPSLFGGIQTSTNTSTSTTSSIFSSAPSVTTTGSTLFGGTQPTSFGFESLKPSSLSAESSQSDCKSFTSQSSSSTLSFGDLAKHSPTNTTFKSAKGDPSVWVSKPLFASVTKSDKDGAGDGDEDYDPHYEPVIPMPELVDVTTGEEGWNELYSHRAKVYRFDAVIKEWKERGLGDFKIQFEPNLNKYRFLQRRDQVHKLSCNHYITPSLTLDPMSTSETAWCWTATDFSEKPEGEMLKLAVRFKTKEIATDFKNSFDACVEKMKNETPAPTAPTQSKSEDATGVEEQGEHQTFAEVSSTASSFVVIDQPQFQQRRDTEETDYGDDADEYEDISGSEETVDDDEGGEDSDDEEQTLIFTDKCQLSVKVDQDWQSRGPCELKITYDDEAFGARIVGTSDEGEKFLDHLIAIQTTIYNEDDRSVCWTSLDEREEPPKKVDVRATFLNDGSVRRFEAAFEEGKEYAYNSGIEETCQNEVPEELLYYGQASDD